MCQIYTYNFQEKGAYHTTWGSTKVDREAERIRGMHGPEPLSCFP